MRTRIRGFIEELLEAELEPRTIEETGKKLGVSVPPSAAPPEQAYYYRPYYHRRYYHDHPKSKRVEFRCPDPACNPYLAFAAMLMAGLNGFEIWHEPLGDRGENMTMKSPDAAAFIREDIAEIETVTVAGLP